MSTEADDEAVDFRVPFYWTRVVISMLVVALLAAVVYFYRIEVMSAVTHWLAPVIGPG